MNRGRVYELCTFKQEPALEQNVAKRLIVGARNTREP